MGVHSGYNSFLLKQKENSGSVTATFRDMVVDQNSFLLEGHSSRKKLTFANLSQTPCLTFAGGISSGNRLGLVSGST